MRVLGVDPGLGRTGVALVEGHQGSLRLLHAECIETGAEEADGPRLLELSRLLAQSAGSLHPDVAAVERLFFSTNRQTAMRVSQARGVILCTLAAAGIPIAEYTPNEIKESVAGYGGATKRQVLRMCEAMLGVDQILGPDDTADACAAAICHHHRAGLQPRAAPAPASRVSPALELAIAAARERAGGVTASRPAPRPSAGTTAPAGRR
ncbi:MAG: crossover junction endodeoxyribonuclease RuvC [Candidatus Dormibacteria bacterium]